MPVQMTKAQRKEFLDSLDARQRRVVENILQAVSLQAEIIEDLTLRLRMWRDTDEMNDRVLMGVSLARLARKLEDPPVSGPTLDEVSAAIARMKSDIQRARSAGEIFSVILGFAAKLAPLAV